MRNLDRLLRPRSIAVVGGGAWCANVLRECRKIGFSGDLWPVHPRRTEMAGLPVFSHVEDLPGAPDAVFVGVNRYVTVETVALLSGMGAGGAICFASGFAEAERELADGPELQRALIDAAGDMPILGPNCYGLLNALDGAVLWPDQHGLVPVERGVAFVLQSSNIACNISMQARGLPIAYILTAGNQAQTDLAEMGRGLLADPRVTALGLHIEGIADLRGLEALSREARAVGKSIVALKVGASDQARAATVSHTASVAGSDAGGRAVLARLGIAQARTLSDMLETLKILHAGGPLASNRIASMSCSGGEASLMADLALDTGLVFPALQPEQAMALAEALGPKVALANPLDYHTYIWGDGPATASCFRAMMQGDLAMGCAVLDFPRPDRCDGTDWHKVVEAAVATQAATGKRMAVLGSIPETMPEAVADAAMAQGIVPFCGMGEALAAMDLAAWLGEAREDQGPVLMPGRPVAAQVLSEAEAKARLAAHGVRVPRAGRAASPEAAARVAQSIGFPVVLKGEGVAHKTEAGAIALNLRDAAAVGTAVRGMGAESVLVEEMVSGGLVELLVGVVRDPAHGFVLTLGAGGTLTEILKDTASLLLPASRGAVQEALSRLKIAPLLAGYRGAAAVNMAAVLDTVMAVQAFVTEEASWLEEVEINPLICTGAGAIAADALITIGEKT
ncbi:acetate--CoA ligase family protein [Nioella nitratireducens]|uniref:acetate--CoA ligase family protein n=1 Tax=Nioella nitratireducens TaxID=1287720 RepID=UPI0008FD91DA|nr:acetate--CoA ligase family protein [Nioella nitratireducens]